MPRRALDFYETPPHYIAPLLHETQPYGRVLEPCVGEGAIARALEGRVCHLDTNDIDRDRKADTYKDARSLLVKKPYDWIITNPPFSQELEILLNLRPQGKNLAFLARLSFLEPTEDREQFLTEHPPNQVIVLPRYSFRLNDQGKRQTDSVTCCWLIWREINTPLGITCWSRSRAEAQAFLLDLV